MKGISCEQSTLGKNSKSTSAIRKNKKNSWNTSLTLRGLIIVAMISMMVLAPSAVDAKSDNGKKIGHDKIKTNNGKSQKNNSVKLEINLNEYVTQSSTYSCNLEKPCFLNLLIKYDNKIIEDSEILKLDYVTIDGISIKPDNREYKNISYDYHLSSQYKTEMNVIEEQLKDINTEDNYLDIRSIGKNSHNLKNIASDISSYYDNENFQYIKNDKYLIKKLSYLENKYIKTINDYKTSLEDYQRNNDLPISKRLLINQIIKDSQIFKKEMNEFNSEKDRTNFIKSELEKIQTENEFRKLMLKIAIEHDDKYGHYDNDEILIDAIEKSIETESWNVLNLAIDEISKRHADTKLAEKIPNMKNLIKKELSELNEIDSYQDVFFLKSENQAQNPSKNVQNSHEITSKNLLKSIVKSNLKEISNDIKNTVNEHKAILKQNYANALDEAEKKSSSNGKSSDANLGNSGQSSPGKSANAGNNGKANGKDK